MIERFNSRLRDECLNAQVFVTLDDARRKIERRRVECNHERPHSSLVYLTPEAFAAIKRNEPARTAGQRCGPARCRARRSRPQSQTVFRPTLKAGEGWVEKLQNLMRAENESKLDRY